MPRKIREVNTGNSQSTCAIHREETSHKEWDPLCTREDDDQSSSSDDSCAVEAQGSHVSSYEEITYENVDFVRMTSCVYVKKSIKAQSDSAVILDGLYDYHEVNPFVGCAPYEYTVYDLQKKIKLQLQPVFGTLSDAGVSCDLSMRFLEYGSSQLETLVSLCQTYALQNFIPKLDDGFSLPVFLAEFAQMKSLFASVASLLLKLPAAIRSLFTRPLRDISNAWLSSIYGWIPFISDCRKIAKKLFELRTSVSQFVSESGRRKTFHYGLKLDPANVYGPGWLTESSEINLTAYHAGDPLWYAKDLINEVNCVQQNQKTFSSFRYGATMDFSYNIPDMGILTSLLAGLDKFGVNLSVSDLWEIIPFSFVVDWFINIGNWLSRFDFTNLPVQVVVYDFCETIKYGYTDVGKIVAVTGVNLQGDTTPYEWTASPVSAALTYSEAAFYRWRRFPTLSITDQLQFGLPDGWQIVNGLALMGQRTS